MVVGRVEEGEAVVFGGEDIGAVDAVVAGFAEGGVVGGAEQQRLVFVAGVALNLHLPLFFLSSAKASKLKRSANKMEAVRL